MQDMLSYSFHIFPDKNSGLRNHLKLIFIAQIFSAVKSKQRKRKTKARLFTIGLGSDVDHAFLQQLARQNDGSSYGVDVGEEKPMAEEIKGERKALNGYIALFLWKTRKSYRTWCWCSTSNGFIAVFREPRIQTRQCLDKN